MKADRPFPKTYSNGKDRHIGTLYRKLTPRTSELWKRQPKKRVIVFPLFNQWQSFSGDDRWLAEIEMGVIEMLAMKTLRFGPAGWLRKNAAWVRLIGKSIWHHVLTRTLFFLSHSKSFQVEVDTLTEHAYWEHAYSNSIEAEKLLLCDGRILILSSFVFHAAYVLRGTRLGAAGTTAWNVPFSTLQLEIEPTVPCI